MRRARRLHRTTPSPRWVLPSNNNNNNLVVVVLVLSLQRGVAEEVAVLSGASRFGAASRARQLHPQRLQQARASQQQRRQQARRRQAMQGASSRRTARRTAAGSKPAPNPVRAQQHRRHRSRGRRRRRQWRHRRLERPTKSPNLRRMFSCRISLAWPSSRARRARAAVVPAAAAMEVRAGSS